MIVVVANSSDTQIRQVMYSGVLMFHSSTKSPVARGNTALSERLLSDFKAGFKFSFLDKLRLKQTIVSTAGDFDSFLKNAPVYYANGSIILSVQNWDTDLTERTLNITKDLKIVPEKSFELVELEVRV